ncbi:MAG: hypothetical protein NZT92_08995 [Abditibacteriales bacterium]|nr:hypothetical protein [Abditibacteriales bacterium]MDW8366128.1 hypothetical protein [Abditibacteriales bacterium]
MSDTLRKFWWVGAIIAIIVVGIWFAMTSRGPEPPTPPTNPAPAGPPSTGGPMRPPESER